MRFIEGFNIWHEMQASTHLQAIDAVTALLQVINSALDETLTQSTMIPAFDLIEEEAFSIMVAVVEG